MSVSIARASADIVGHTAQRPSIFTSSSRPRLNATRVSTSISSSRAASTASAQRGSSSNFQHTIAPEITSARSVSGSSSVPRRLYWPVMRAAMPSR